MRSVRRREAWAEEMDEEVLLLDGCVLELLFDLCIEPAPVGRGRRGGMCSTLS